MLAPLLSPTFAPLNLLLNYDALPLSFCSLLFPKLAKQLNKAFHSQYYQKNKNMQLKNKILFFMFSTLFFACDNSEAQNNNINISSGKKVFIDGNDIRTSAGGSRVLYIDGNDIRPNPGGNRLLFLDGSDVRPEPGGARLAFWDGSTLRRTPGGNIVLKIDGNTVRNANGEKMFTFESGNYSQVQITAALYHLNPNIFKPSAEELAAAQAAIAEGQAWDNEQASNTHENGNYELIHAMEDYKTAGDCSIKWQGSRYVVALGNGEQGVAIKRDDSGYRLTGVLGKGNCLMGIFSGKGNAYKGAWYQSPTANPQSETYNAVAQQISDTPFNSSQAGTLTFTPSEKTLEYEGKVYEVSSSNGQTGLAYEVGYQRLGYCLVIVLGEHVALHNLKIEGDMISGEIVGNNAKGFVLYNRK